MHISITDFILLSIEFWYWYIMSQTDLQWQNDTNHQQSLTGKLFSSDFLIGKYLSVLLPLNWSSCKKENVNNTS